MKGGGSPPYNDSMVKDNLLLLAFLALEATATAGIEKFVDGFVDQFEDNSGVDAGASTGESYDAVNDKWGLGAASMTAGTCRTVAGDVAYKGGRNDVIANLTDDLQTSFGEDWDFLITYSDLSTVGTWGAAHSSNRNVFISGGTLNLGIQWTPAANKSVSKIKVELVTTGASICDLRAAVYTDNAGKPDALLGYSNSITPAIGDIELTFSTVVPVSSGTPYWIVISPYQPPLSLVSNSYEAETNDPSKVRLLLAVDLNSLAINLNVDTIGYISIDDGTNWETITLTYQGLDGTGRALYSGEVTPTPRGDKTVRMKFYTSINVYLKAWGCFLKW